MIFHNEEKHTTAFLESYEDSHPNSPIIMTFTEGDIYKCQFYTAYESDNGLELDNPDYDEFYELVYKVLETITLGNNSYKEKSERWITVNYKHFPICITNESGLIIYKR